jgi:hypothetical protein
MKTFPLLSKFLSFVVERHRIYERRFIAKDPAPWTDDPILAAFRFCNVYRELDRTTIWIKDHWRDPSTLHPDVWFLMALARFVNRPETLARFLPITNFWNADKFTDILLEQKRAGQKVFGGAYIISTNGQATDKAIYLRDEVLDPLWEARRFIRPRTDDTLRGFFNRLTQSHGMGSFMAAQVVADTKYTESFNSRMTSDWWTFAASGPGSRRGMNYLLGRPPSTHWIEHEWFDILTELASEVRSPLKEEGLSRLHAQDLQNCLCEFSKYRRSQLGMGRPKARFTPVGG